MTPQEIRLECLKLADGDVHLAKRYSDYALYECTESDGKSKPAANPGKGKK